MNMLNLVEYKIRTAMSLGAPYGKSVVEEMVDFKKLLKKSKLPRLTIDVASCMEFTRLCAEEVDRAFPDGVPSLYFLRKVLAHVKGDNPPMESGVITAIIDIYNRRGGPADKLGDALLSLHRMQFNGVTVDSQSLEKWAREARDYAEQTGLPDMGPINAYFVLLFR